MKQIKTTNKTQSIDIKTNAKQSFIEINGQLIHINTFYDGKIIITTYNIKKVELNTSTETTIEHKKY